MIRIALRKNLIYILQVIIHYYLRRIVSTIIRKVYKFNDSLIFTLLMHLGELFGGLASYLYQNKFLKPKPKIPSNATISQYIIPKELKMKKADNNYKIIILIFFAAFFDFMGYILATFFVPKIARLSPTADIRLTSVTTISSTLIFIYALKLKIGRHHFYSLIIIGTCLLLIIIVELIYQVQSESPGNLLIAYLLSILSLVFITFTDSIEKYLCEFDFLSPFLILTTEAIFGIILVLIISYQKNPFSEIKKISEELNAGWLILLIFLLFLYLAFSAGANVYKILTNVLYSPMAKSLSIYILNPALIIYSYFYEDDFSSKEGPNPLYLIINLILAIIIAFFGCVFNEFLILYCCRLEHETHYMISQRSKDTVDLELTEIRELNAEEDNNDEIDILYV